MKKILILLLIGLFMMSGISAQEFVFDISNYEDVDGTIDLEAAIDDINTNGADTAVILPALLEGDTIDNIDFSSVMPDIDLAIESDEKTKLVEALEEQGIDTATIDATMLIAEKLQDGETLADIKESDPEAFAEFEDTLIAIVAEQAKSQILTEDIKAQLDTALTLVNFSINTLKGFAQSTALTSNAGNMFGYQGYKLLTVSVGMFGALAVPESLDTANDTISLMNNLTNDQDPIEELQDLFEEKNISAGITGQGLVMSVGLNLNWLVERLYLGVVFGSTGISISKDDGLDALVMDSSVYNTSIDDLGLDALDEIPSFEINMGSSIYGIRANYQFLKGFGIPILFRWNGLSLGTGFIITTMNIDAKMDLSTMLDLDPESFGIEFGIDSTTFTIPLEVSTGVQLLSIATITAGAGVDLQFGSSNTYMKLNTANEDSFASKVVNETINSVVRDNGLNFPLDSEGTLELINPRINAGIGIGLGPVVFDFSAYYYLRTGVAFGANFLIRL